MYVKAYIKVQDAAHVQLSEVPASDHLDEELFIELITQMYANILSIKMN